jgi:hypothetical protein
MRWRTWLAGASLYVLVSTMGYGIRLEDASDWTDGILRACSACYFVDWLYDILQPRR